jgi:hypothetical protein
MLNHIPRFFKFPSLYILTSSLKTNFMVELSNEIDFVEEQIKCNKKLRSINTSLTKPRLLN